jgi:hypothetical protein
MMKPLGILLVACLAVSAVDATAGSRSQSVHRLSAPSPPTFVGPGVTLAIDDVVAEAAAYEPGLIAVSLTLANSSGIALNLHYRDFGLAAGADERYPALLPAELDPTPRSEMSLREGVLRSGESMSAVLYFRTPALRSRWLELRVDLSDVNDTPVARGFVPILRAPGDHS